MKFTESWSTDRATSRGDATRPTRGDVNARLLERVRAAVAVVRIRQEGLYDRLSQRFHQALDEAGGGDRAAERVAVARAREELVASAALTPAQGDRLASFLLRDLDRTDRRRRTGDVTAAGTLACMGCGFTLKFRDTATVPPCPKCAATGFTRSA